MMMADAQHEILTKVTESKRTHKVCNERANDRDPLFLLRAQHLQVQNSVSLPIL